MDPKDVPSNTEAELESFRQKWREEVTARSKAKAPGAPTPAKSVAASSSSSKPHAAKSNVPETTPHPHARQPSVDEDDQPTPYVHHDLGEKQHGRRLDETDAQAAAAVAASKEPSSALEHYEKAVEKESQGSLGDSVNLYRKAFKVR
jgi:F-box protein 9